MMVRFRGLRVLVTGGGRGLGLALVQGLAREGAEVFAACRDPEGAASVLPKGTRAVALDVEDSISIAALGKRLEGEALDILINNAAIRGDTGGLDTLEAEGFLQVMRVNALGPLLVAQALLPALRRGARKMVVNISSRAGSMTEGLEAEGDYAYRCSKAALNMAGAKLAFDLAADGFTVLGLHPGWVKTDMGGPEAEITAGQSVAGLLDVIASSGPADTGSFRSYDGSPIAW